MFPKSEILSKKDLKPMEFTVSISTEHQKQLITDNTAMLKNTWSNCLPLYVTNSKILLATTNKTSQIRYIFSYTSKMKPHQCTVETRIDNLPFKMYLKRSYKSDLQEHQQFDVKITERLAYYRFYAISY